MRMSWLFFSLALSACSPVKMPIENEYKLSHYGVINRHHEQGHKTILITHPEASSGYDTEQMLYTIKPFSIENFAHNAWLSPPADMLLPLLVQSVQKSRFFYAVASTTTSELTDYRLDTQLIELQQNFLKKPSQIDFVAKIVLSDVEKNRILASRIIEEHITCPSDTPYGGVIAANQATEVFTKAVTQFVITTLGKQ